MNYSMSIGCVKCPAHNMQVYGNAIKADCSYTNFSTMVELDLTDIASVSNILSDRLSDQCPLHEAFVSEEG